MTTSPEPVYPSPDMEDAPGALVIGPDDVSVISETHEGPVEVYGSLAIEGALIGTLTVESLGRVLISGDVDGPIEVRVAANVFVLPSGRVAGTITNNGSFINQGWRSGRVDGREPDDQDGSYIAEPIHGRYSSPPAR